MKIEGKILIFLIICVLIKSCYLNKIKLHTKYEAINLSSAISNIITKAWLSRHVTVNVIKADNVGAKLLQKKNIINMVAKNSYATEEIAFRIEAAKSINYIPLRPKQTNLFTVESFADFEEAFRTFSPLKFQINGDFLIVLSHGRIPEVDEIFKMLWSLQVLNVNIIYEVDNGTVFVETFSPFDSLECSNTEPKVVNTFKDGEFEYDVKMLYSEKLHDLHWCPVRVATSNNSIPYVFADKHPNGSYDLHGRDISLINTLGEALRFKINFVFVGEEGYLLENGTAEGPFELLLQGKADVIVADYWLKVNRLKFIDNTTPYINQHIAFIIPPGAELSSLEKFIKPLDYYTWALLIFYITVGIVVIYCVRRGSTDLQDFVFGTGVKDPYINVIVAIFGSSQKIIPQKNFARYLLMMFLMYCLIMRTLYTGSLYRFLQSKVYHKEAQSIDEMIQKDFKFYTVSAIMDLLEGQSKIYERLMK